MYICYHLPIFTDDELVIVTRDISKTKKSARDTENKLDSTSVCGKDLYKCEDSIVHQRIINKDLHKTNEVYFREDYTILDASNSFGSYFYELHMVIRTVRKTDVNVYCFYL